MEQLRKQKESCWRGNVEKLKVVIVDDEERICQLIQALINWEEMGLQVEGMAHNGIDA